MRKTSDGQVVYNLDEEYIADIVEEYFEEEEGEIWEGYDKRNVSGNPKGNEYLVTLGDRGFECECVGFGYHGSCKHSKAVVAQVEGAMQ